MNDIKFLQQLVQDLKTASWSSADIDRLYVVIEHLMTLTQGYSVIPDPDKDKSREAHDRWKDKSE